MMNAFDLLLNFNDALLESIFVLLVLRNRKVLPFLISTLLFFLSLCISEIYALPEIISIFSSMIILYGYADYLAPHNKFQSLFYALFMNVILNLASTFYVTLSSVFEVDFLVGFGVSGYVLMTVIEKAVTWGLILIFSKQFRPYKLLQGKLAGYIIIALAILNWLYSALIDYIYFGQLFDPTLNLLLILVDALTISLCFVFFEAQRKQALIISLERENMKISSMEKLNELNERNYQAMRKWKHDMKHIFSSLGYLLKQEQYDEASEVVNDYLEQVGNNDYFASTGNEGLDYLLLQKIAEIKRRDIRLFVDCKDEACPIDAKHFFIILGNLLDNAIENCASEGQLQIYLTLKKVSNYYCISVKNSIIARVLDKNPDLLTTKDNPKIHGMGLNNVKTLVHHHDGKMKISDNDGFFAVKIIFFNRT